MIKNKVLNYINMKKNKKNTEEKSKINSVTLLLILKKSY